MVARLVCLLLATAALAGENVFPDPGFEATGTVGPAHAGQKAGHLTIGNAAHWLPLGGELKTEPFATYRATAWVKGTWQTGTCLALYVYEWDSYVWAFSTNVPVPKGDTWQQVSVTFRSPGPTIWLHPLAFLDASHGEAWIDDVVVEQIATPAETVKALAAKGDRTADENRLLARYYLSVGDRAAAKALLRPTGDRAANADIACVLAKSSTDRKERAELLGAMVRNGAPGYNDGMLRVREVAEGLELPAAMDDLRGALVADAQNKDAWRTYALCLSALLRLRPAGPGLVGTRKALVDRLVQEAQAAQAASGTPLPAEVAALAQDAATERARLESDMQQLGSATVVIGGRAVTAQTHVIVLPAEPTPSERMAATDLQVHLERITGQVIPLVQGQAPAGKTRLIVGRHPLVAALKVPVDYAKLGAEGLRLKNVGSDLVLTGGQRGVLYAVYELLEQHLGCRWFTADCQTWPRSGRLVVPNLDLTFVPALEYRATDYPNSRPAEFAVRNHLNGNQIQATLAWGGNIRYKGFVHTFDSLVPPEQYGATHPEYFSELGGKRTPDESQLCLTNPDVLKVAIAAVRRWIAEDPTATIVSVSQNDRFRYCTCAKCKALADDEGAQSGPLLHFVNAIADDIAKDHPNIIIDTLAYQWTRKPPLHVRPRPNVAVRLCSIECEFNRPLATSPFNATFVNDIKGWHALCNRLHIWDYVINYAHTIQPFPNLKVLGPNIRFFIANGVTGIYEEADYYTTGGEMAELRTWLMAKLLWHPDYDVEKGIDEFCAAYYGPAAPFIRAYLNETHRLAVSDPSFHMPIYVGVRSPFQTPEAVAHYRAWFAQAEAAVQTDPVRLHRVQVAKLPVLYTQIAQRSASLYRLGDTSLQPVAGTSVADLAAEFGRIGRAEGMTRVSEGGPDFETWLQRVGPGAQEQPIVRLKGGGLEAVVVPGLGGRVLSLKDAKGNELLQVVTEAGGLSPTVGGYKEFSQSGYQSPGYIEPFAVSEQSATGVTLTATVGKAIKLVRRYDLDPTLAVLRIKSTETNTSNADQQACLRAHTCLRLGDAKAARLRLGPAGAKAVSLASGADKEEELWYRGADRPAGEWAVLDVLPGVDLTARFKLDQAATCYFNWSGPDHRCNPELWTADRVLKPGESQTLEQEYAWLAR